MNNHKINHILNAHISLQQGNIEKHQCVCLTVHDLGCDG